MSLTFRPLARTDFGLLSGWFAKPHVAKWWHDGDPVEHVARKYGPVADGTDNTAGYIVNLDKKPLGFIQSYRLADYKPHLEQVNLGPGAVGVDLFIGEEDGLNRGWGTAVLQMFVLRIIKNRYPDATHVAADPGVENGASIRAFEKAGFKKDIVTVGDEGMVQAMVLTLGLS